MTSVEAFAHIFKMKIIFAINSYKILYFVCYDVHYCYSAGSYPRVGEGPGRGQEGVTLTDDICPLFGVLSGGFL